MNILQFDNASLLEQANTSLTTYVDHHSLVKLFAQHAALHDVGAKTVNGNLAAPHRSAPLTT